MRKIILFISVSILIIGSGIVVYIFYKSNQTQFDQELQTRKQISMNQLKSSRFVEPITGEVYVSSQIVVTGETTAKDVKFSLLCNGKTVATQKISPGKFQIEQVDLEPGVNLMEALLEDKYQQQFVLAGPAVKYIPLNSRDYDYIKTAKKVVALTFDGDEESSGTLALLDMLKEKNVKCTVFVTGNFIRLFPKIVQRIVDDGHEIGNHTNTHPHLLKVSTSTENYSLIQKQLAEPARLFKKVTGRNMLPFWRAPFGEYNKQILGWAAQCGYIHIRWSTGLYGKGGSLDTLDWVADPKHEWYHPSDEIVSRILKLADKGIGGGVVLMHLGSLRKEEDRFYHKLPDLIDGLRNQGYTLVTVSDLIISAIEDRKKRV